MTEPTKQLGDDWDLDKMTPSDMLFRLNDEFSAKWQRTGYDPPTAPPITVTLPARKIDELKRRFIGTDTAPVCIWDWLLLHNILKSNGVPFQILPRYSFKDVKGVVDSVNFEMGQQTQAALDAFSPVTATGEQLDRLMDLMPAPIQRMRLEKDHPDAVPDPSLGGWMESDDSLRKRMLAHIASTAPKTSLVEGPMSPAAYAIVTGSRGGGKTASSFMVGALAKLKEAHRLVGELDLNGYGPNDNPQAPMDLISEVIRELEKQVVPLHKFVPFGKGIWCNICGQREGAKTHPQEGK